MYTDVYKRHRTTLYEEEKRRHDLISTYAGDVVFYCLSGSDWQFSDLTSVKYKRHPITVLSPMCIGLLLLFT